MQKTTEQKYFGSFDEVFPIINPSELIGHRLLTHRPRNKRQKRLMVDIWRGLDLKLPAFRVSCMDPSEEDGKIVFKAGTKPAVGHSADWWNETWKKFMQSKNSRIGTDLHYAAFLGKIMKYLVEEKNYSIEDAWKAVCDDSRELGHYNNSKDSKNTFEPTGSRKIGEFFDLANTCKILRKWGTTEYLIAGGTFWVKSKSCPLADLSESMPSSDDPCYNSLGWFVMDI